MSDRGTHVVFNSDIYGRGVVICGALENVGPRGHKKTVWENGNVPYLDLFDGEISVYICQNSSNCTLKIYALYCM